MALTSPFWARKGNQTKQSLKQGKYQVILYSAPTTHPLNNVTYFLEIESSVVLHLRFKPCALFRCHKTVLLFSYIVCLNRGPKSCMVVKLRRAKFQSVDLKRGDIPPSTEPDFGLGHDMGRFCPFLTRIYITSTSFFRI